MGSRSLVVREPVERARKRRWPGRWCTVLLATVLLIWCMPRLVCCPPIRDAILRGALPHDAGHLQLERLVAGWFTPVEAHGLRYRSPQWELIAESARCDRTLFDLLKDPFDWGHIALTAPRLTVAASPNVPRFHHEGKGGVEHARPAPGRPIICEVEATHGELGFLDGSDGWKCVAHDVAFELHAPPASDRASFQFIGRTGDPHATAHFSAYGTLTWPHLSWPAGLLETHLDLVGVDIALACRMLAATGFSHPSPQGPVVGTAIRGIATGNAELGRTEGESLELRANLEVQEVSVADSCGSLEFCEPTVSLNFVVRLAPGTWRIDSLRLQSDSLTIDATGTVTGWSDEARADLAGFALCDWAMIESRLQPVLSPDIHVAGKERRPWRLRGPLRSHSLAQMARQVEVDLGTHIDALDLFGLELGPIELQGHWKDGAIQCDPVELSLAGGQVTVQPRVKLQPESLVLELPTGKVLDRIAINSKVCNWLLRYVDPLFTISSNLRGQLSLEIDRLEIPLGPNGLEHGLVEGRLLLDEVEFSPDQSVQEILAIAGMPLKQSVRTSQTIAIRLQDGRVHHTGLALPVGDDPVTLEGWVGLDHTLNIQVSLPVTEQMLGKDKRLHRLLHGQRIDVPVTGTLEHPKVNEDALAHNIQRLIQITLRDSLGGDDALRGLLRRAIK